MPIAVVHELITNSVRVKVTSHGYCYYRVYRWLKQNTTVQLRGQQEAISIQQCITWYKVERTNLLNNLWHWEASLSHMFKIHTHTHKAHHKYAFVPLLVETSPGNILNVTPYIFISLSLAVRGWRTQQEARDHQFMREWKNMLLICNTFLQSARWQKDDKC